MILTLSALQMQFKRFPMNRILPLSVLSACLLPIAGNSQSAPDPDGYRFYRSGACVAAVNRATSFYWRDRVDTARPSTTADTLLTSNSTVAKECISGFNIDTVPDRDLLLLAQLQMIAGNEEEAMKTIERKREANASASVSIRTRMLRDIHSVFINAKPVKLDLALQTLAELDAVPGSEAAVEKLSAHGAMLAYYINNNSYENVMLSGRAMIDSWKQLSQRDRIEFQNSAGGAYERMLEAEGSRAGHYDGVKALLQEALATFADYQWALGSMQFFDSYYRLYGTPGPRLTAEHWVGDPGDTIRPRQGKVTILSFYPWRGDIPPLRRLAEMFPDDLDVVIVYSTFGHFRFKGPLDIDTEVHEIASFMKEIGAPGVFAITPSNFHKMADGRLNAISSDNDMAYDADRGNKMVILDKNGIIRRVFRDRWQKWMEESVESTIRQYK